MANGRQELRLTQARSFGSLLSRQEFDFSTFAPGYVLLDRYEVVMSP